MTADDDELLVHADELMLRGDPLGELIVVAREHARDPTPERARREAALIAIQRSRLDAVFGDTPMPHYTWRLGLVDAIDFDHLGNQPFDALPKLARDPATQRVRALHLHAWQYGGHDAEAVLRELAALRLPHLREIVVSDIEDTSAGRPTRIGDLAPLYAAYPQLEVLALAGRQPELGTLELPALRRLALADLRADDVRRIVAARVPALAALALAFPVAATANIAATFGPLLHRELPALVALRLQPPIAALGYIAGELATCPLARHLTKLALVGPLADDAIEALVEAAPALQRLEHFELAGSALSAASQKRLRRCYGRALDVR